MTPPRRSSSRLDGDTRGGRPLARPMRTSDVMTSPPPLGCYPGYVLRPLRRPIPIPLLVAVAVAYGGGSVAAAPAAGTTSGPVLEHHGGPTRAGVYADPALTRAAAARVRPDVGFRATIDGAVYAQPLYVPGARGGRALVVAASQRNEVAAFDAATGAPVWRRRLGTPVPLSALPCGNIDPLGVTGTPVVDPSSRTLYLDAMDTPDGGATKRHRLFALGVDDGADRPGWPLEVAAIARAGGVRFDAAVQNQRGALALVAGTLYVPFGGHFGDCGDYRGWLVAVPVRNPGAARAWATGARGGGIWGPSGVSSDGASVFVATGNTFDATTWSGGEAILRFPAGVPLPDAPADAFAPANWKALDAGDVDLGGTGPVMLDLPGTPPARLAVGLGKDGKIYLVDRARMGGIGGALVATTVASSSIINAAAAYTTAKGTYVVFRGAGAACPGGRSGGRSGGLTAVRITSGAPPRVATAWCAPLDGRGSPMVTTTDGQSEAVVWAVGAEGDGRLHGFDGDTGAVVSSGAGGEPLAVRRFQTPILAGGRIYVAVDGGVRAFVPGP